MNALELQGLTKHYKDFTLGPLDLTLPGGTICGLIGEIGAGKSTTFRRIFDMVQRDGGTVTTAPPATPPGVRTFTCTVCSQTRTEAIPATGARACPGARSEAPRGAKDG